MNISIIGAGKVGTAFGVLLEKKGYTIVSVISRKRKSAWKLAKLVNCTLYSNNVLDVHPSSELIIISTPEEVIEDVAKEITRLSAIDFNKLIVFHTSGVLTSDVLSCIHKKGAIIFSLHPIQSFPKKMSISEQMTKMRGIYYGFEGINGSHILAKKLVKSLGGKLIQIPKEKKILYHIACVFASNYSVALLGATAELTKRICKNFKLEYLSPLVRTSIENAFRQSPREALTGPIRRGSWKVIELHLKELEEKNKRLTLLYRTMGTQTLRMTISGKKLEPRISKKIEQILKSNK